MSRGLAFGLLVALAATLGFLAWFSRPQPARTRSPGLAAPAPPDRPGTVRPPGPISPLASTGALPSTFAPFPASSAAPPLPDWPKQELTVWFEGGDEKLHGERRSEPVPPGPTGAVHAALAALLAGPRSESLVANWPTGGAVRAVFLAPPGVVTVDLDLTPESLEGWGAHSEWMALQSLVATVIGLVPEAGGVVVTIRGEGADTLGGHVDLGRPLRLAPTLLAREESAAAGSGTAAPEANGGEEPPPAPRAMAPSTSLWPGHPSRSGSEGT